MLMRAIIAPIGADAEVAARQQIQADTAASNQAEGSEAVARLRGQTASLAVVGVSGRAQAEAIQHRIERPRELRGATWQIPFDGQNLYVTVNHDGKMIQEVFATGPISGGVGLLASKMLRGGFDAAEVAYSLEQGDRHARRLVQRASADFARTGRCRVHHDHQPAC